MTTQPRPALITLVDGTVFRGQCVAGDGEVFGEMVFNTSMTGYQEVLTDPSYAGQIVTMTSPQIGNYGVAPDDADPSPTLHASERRLGPKEARDHPLSGRLRLPRLCSPTPATERQRRVIRHDALGVFRHSAVRRQERLGMPVRASRRVGAHVPQLATATDARFFPFLPRTDPSTPASAAVLTLPPSRSERLSSFW